MNNITQNFVNRGLIKKETVDNFTKEKKLEIIKLGLPKANCIIVTMFLDSNDPVYNQLDYCLHNCGLKCLCGKEYKKKY